MLVCVGYSVFQKYKANVERDDKNIRDLEVAGWQVMTVWGCKLKNANEDGLDQRLSKSNGGNMQGRVLNIILFILFVLGSGLASWADIYVWEDEHGVKHFSNDGGAQDYGNVTVHDEVTWSADDEEKWKREKNEERLKHSQKIAVHQKINDDQARKKKACMDAKEAYEKVKRKYSEFVPAPLPHYAGLPEKEIPSAIRHKRAMRKKNQERREQWEQDKKQAYDLAEKNIERCCK